MNDNPRIDYGQLLLYLGIALLILVAMQATQPIQQQAPGYNGNTWHSTVTIINEDNDTNISVDGCIGYCPDK